MSQSHAQLPGAVSGGPRDTTHNSAVTCRSSAAPQWSIIVIARNEEACIGACLESVLRTFASRSYELIVVDSASTDRTVAIAAIFPARILQLPETAPLRPAAGRHIGFTRSRGRWILFLDGDSTLDTDWLEEAEAAFKADPELGGVAGEMEHRLHSAESGTPVKFNQPYPDADYEAADFLGGSAAYTREALLKAGGFNPHLRSCEEAELGARVRKAGYRLLRLRSIMTRHFPKHADETAPELLRRIRRGFFVGLGQFPRYCYFQRLPVVAPFITIRRHVQFFVLAMLGLLAGTVSVVLARAEMFLAWAAGMMLVFVVFAAKSGSVRKPAYYFLEWTLASPLVIWGLVQRPRTIGEFIDTCTHGTGKET